MKIDTTVKIILGVIAILLLFSQLKGVLGWDVEKETTKVETIRVIETKYDTIVNTIEKVIVKEPIYTNTTKTVYLPSENVQIDSLGQKDSIIIDLPIHNYQDTIKVDSARLFYNHTIAGYLEGSKYKIWYPKETITITDTIKTTNTIIKNRVFDFMLIGGYQFRPTPQYEMGIDLVARKWKIGIRTGYDPTLQQQTYRAELGMRIFGI